MSDYWLNRIGAVATASTPSGAIPEYGLAYDLGTADWPDAQTFNAAVSDVAARKRADDLAAMEAAKSEADQGWFQRMTEGVVNAIGGGSQEHGGIKSIPILGTYLSYLLPETGPEGLTEEQYTARGADMLETVAEAPVIKQLNQAWEAGTRPFETAFLMDRNTAMREDMSLWFDGSAWAAAWREAEDRTLGEAFADAIFTGQGDTQEDLDRRRRTNSLYGIVAFGSELAAGWKFDPTVLGAKGISEARRINLGAVPRETTSITAATEASRVLRAEDPRSVKYRGLNPAGYYGNWRGQRIFGRYDNLRDAARSMSYTEFSNLPMFSKRATSGSQAALAFQIAAKSDDPKLWDLTRRLTMGDAEAWHQLRAMRESPEQFPDYFRDNTDTATFIDAIEATKTKIKSLDSEIQDLEKLVAKREETGPQPSTDPARREALARKFGRENVRARTNPGFFEHHTWELHRDLEGKVRDLAEADAALAKYSDYADWLNRIEDPQTGIPLLENVDVRPSHLDKFRARTQTYQDNPFGPAHRVSSLPRSVWTQTANPIDTHRVDSGTMSIRRQFEQFAHLLNYRDNTALDDILNRFVRAKDSQERWRIAQEVEDVHLMRALSLKHGLSEDVIDTFLRETRMRRNEMAEVLLSGGKGAIYSSAPIDNPLMQGDSAKLISVANGQAKIEVMDNGVKHTIYVPEESLQAYKRPVDPTQTPQYYQPMDTREVTLAIGREKKLFEELDKELKYYGRATSAATMEAINKFGTAFNALWKPLQLFRLAWPQRVLMDEWFRALAVLGVSAWARSYGPAMRVAAMNAINPTQHNFGIADRWRRRFIKIGPGPVADDVAGRKFDLTHEEIADSAPVVPERFAPKFDGRRATVVQDFLRDAIPMRAQRARARALLRDPNPTKSLPDEAYQWNPPKNWQDIDSALGNSDSHSYTLFDEIPPSEDGIILGGTRPEEFDTGDLAYAAAGIRFTDEDVINELMGSASDVTRVERFLTAPPQLQAQIWNGDLGLGENLLDEWGMAWTNVQDFAHELAPGGRMRPLVRDAVKRGKKVFEDEVRKRRTGAGHKPLFDGVFSEFTGPYARYQLMLAKELGAKWVPVDDAGAAVSSMNLGPMQRRFVVPSGAQDFHIAGETIYEPIKKIHDEALAARKRTARVYDPANGRETRQGWAVRVNSTELPFGGINQLNGDAPLRLLDPKGDWYDAIDDFIVQNQEFLSAKGFRILVEVDHVGAGGTKLSVVRYFRTDQKDSAIEFARHIGAKSLRRLAGLKHKTRTGNLADTGFEGSEYYIADENYGPIFEDLDRIIRDVHDVSDEGSMSKTKPPLNEPDKPVLHGTVRELDEQLLPRALAPLDNGRLMGPGFYTTTDPGTARAYGPNLYTIKGTHDGRTYDVRNLYDPVEHDELVDLQRALERRLSEIDNEGYEYYGDQWADIKRNYRERLMRPYSWEDVLGSLMDYRHPPYNLRLDEWLLDHLMEKGIGAWRTSWGPDSTIYVWFDTENLLIKPAYERVDRWYKVEEWFAHPASRERIVNQVPESRIIRSSKNDPEFRELETIHKRLEARQQEFRRQGKSPYRDPVFQALLAREQSMMQRLGLEYSHNMPAGQGDKVNWWTQVNPQAPGASRYLDSLGRNTTDMQMGAVGDLDVDPIAAFKAELRQYGERGQAAARRMLKRREFGRGYAKVQSHDGADVQYHQMFEGAGEIYVPITSAAPTYARLSDTYRRTLSKYRQRAVGYKRVQPPDVSPERLANRVGRRQAVEYYVQWSDLLNDQVRNSPIWYRMLQGESDEQIVAWLRKTDQGARLRRSLPEKGRNPERWVEQARQRLDYYLPSDELREVLRDRRIRPEDLHRIDPQYLPALYAPDLEEIDGVGAAVQMYRNTIEKVYHALGTVPTDVLSRQPFAKAMYDLKMRNLVAATDSEWLTDDMLRVYEKSAREFAVAQVRRVLYDLTDETNFTQAVRFLAPFWGAQQDAITKWMNIAIERPETVARFYIGINQVYDQMLVIDEDGNPVKDAEGFGDYNPNHRVILHIPNRLKKLPFFDRALNEFGDIGVSFSSANTSLQGDMPLMPSLGPLVTAPADKFFDAMWETNGVQFDDEWFYRWLFPVGRPQGGGVGEVLEQLMPGWGRRMAAMQQGADARMYANTWSIVSREMHYDAAQRNQPPPSREEIEKAVNWHFGLRVIASFSLPAAVEWRPKNQFFLDEYHRMQRDYGPGQALEEFYKKYGRDASRYAASSSSEGLVPATSKGMEDWMKAQGPIQDVIEAGFPDLASALVSPDAWADDFSSDAYNEQFKINIGPGSSQKLRELQNPYERMADTDVRLGWLEYRQFMSAMNAELYARGLTSMEQRGAEDLAQMKRDWVAQQEAQLPAWGLDYREYSDTIYQQVNLLSRYAFDPRFDSRPDIQGLRQYLLIREQATRALDSYAASTGGSRSLQAQENTQLRAWFYDQVGRLVQANPAFGEFYIRFLDSDRLERGSG